MVRGEADGAGTHTELPSRLRLFCGAAAETVESDTNLMHLRFFAMADALDSKFEAVYTAFRDSSSGGQKSGNTDNLFNT
ncbi:uncharacterized protein GBIM_05345 [Gryllus bimaculatus]|nr:uncharacterized protein GBIM_05345 [Gryllus bimaculatus]